MAKPPNYTFKLVRAIVYALVLLFIWNSSFSQDTNPRDSSKTKKQPVTDGTFKHGYAKIVLLGHERIIALPVLQDSDGDGVPDQLDLEPNTPPGVAVDAHGRALDTDGDGVPDYRDKEKLTLQKCFPVDSNGVGTCPEPSCCKELHQQIHDVNSLITSSLPRICELSELPSIGFKKGSWALAEEFENVLKSVAGALKTHPACNLKIIAHYGWVSTELAEQLSWDRANTIVKYLVEKEGITVGRLIFVYDNPGIANSVDLIPTVESGPNVYRGTSPNNQ